MEELSGELSVIEGQINAFATRLRTEAANIPLGQARHMAHRVRELEGWLKGARMMLTGEIEGERNAD